jgi:hypothetical protein
MPSQKFDVEIDFVAKNQDLFDKANKQAKETAQAAKSIKNAYELQREELQKLNPELVKQIDLQKKLGQETQIQIRNIRAQAKEIRTSVALMRDSAGDIDRIAKPLFTVGAAVTGGIFAFANKYVNDAKEATETTRAWKAAQDDLNRSGARIGEVLATEALPVLKDAAKITSEVAGFLERNPEVAGVALKAGLIALALGTIGKAVSSGIRLVADLKLDAALELQNQAAKLQLAASENQLRAAGLQSEASGGGAVAKGAGGIGGLGVAGLVGGAVFAQAEVFKGILKMDVAISQSIEKFTGFETPLLHLARSLGFVTDETQKADAGLSKLANSVSFLGGSKGNQDSAVKAFGDWKADDARIVNEAMQQRKTIIAEGERAIVDLTRNYTSQRTSIERQYSQEAAQITTRYNAEALKAEQDYVKERADILKDSEQRVRDILAEAQEKREEIEKDFQKAARSATADRDALALVQAQEARDEALAEADKGTADAIAKEKEETQRRLQELASRYAQERAERQAQYEQDLKENAARRAAALKEAAERYQAELKQAREANAQKLKEAAEAANKERIERRNQFIDQLADLGIVLNSERQLRNNAYSAMLADLENWLNQMGGAVSNSASSLGTASGGTATNTGYSGSGQYGTFHDYSGYATKGVYRMAQDGKPEWVLSGNDTKAAERALGGQLSQGGMAQMIAAFGAMRGSMQVVDNTSYGKDMTTRQIRDLKEAQARTLDKLLGGL